MSKLVLLWLTLTVSILYLLFPFTSATHDYFLFSDQQLTFPMHVWFICEKLILVIFAYIIATESTAYKSTLNLFFYLQIFRLVDYLLCYNEVWLWIGPVPVSANVLSVLVFGLMVANEYIWKGFK